MVPAREIAVVVGTRPEAIKLAPVILALRRSRWLRPTVIATGQHTTMLHQALDGFGITPDTEIRPSQSAALIPTLAHLTDSLGELLADRQFDMTVVQGDTSSCLAGAVASAYSGVPVAHVEAGLRSGDNSDPFPEEMNRKLTSQLADLNFAPTSRNMRDLVREGIPERRIMVTGNTVIDALEWTLGSGNARLPETLDDHATREVVLVTLHRRESWGSPLARVCSSIRTYAMENPEVLIYFPVHLNPTVRQTVFEGLGGLENVVLADPQPYPEFCALMKRASLVVSDSGGIQEEVPALGRRVIVVRRTTERPEAVEAGVATLVDPTEGDLVKEIESHMSRKDDGKVSSPFGDGLAAARIVRAIEVWFDHETQPFPAFVTR